MNHKSKFREEENYDQTHEVQNQTGQTVKDFASVEELLRHDAATTLVPAELRERVCESVARGSKSPWWNRFFKSKG